MKTEESITKTQTSTLKFSLEGAISQRHTLFRNGVGYYLLSSAQVFRKFTQHSVTELTEPYELIVKEYRAVYHHHFACSKISK